MNLPTDIANQALDAAGIDFTLGDIEEGTLPAQVVLRAYPQCLRQLLRSAHWNFARAQTPLVLLADATGQTPNVGTVVPYPWLYSYAYPIDAMKARFVPWNLANISPGGPSGNIVPANASAPLTGGTQQAPAVGQKIVPARFLEGTDTNYTPPPGSITWETQGISPQGRTVIMTNVKCAHLVYTRLMLYPSNWDANFRAALVAYIASEVCLRLHKDKKFGLTLRGPQIELAKQKITQARISDGNEGWQINTHVPDWIKARNTGGGWAGWPGYGGGGGYAGEGPGILWGGWDCCGFSDGSAY